MPWPSRREPRGSRDTLRRAEARAEQATAEGAAGPFAGFFEREASRRERGRYTRRIVLGSIAIHVVAFGVLLAVNWARVEELFSPSVEVKLFARLPASAEATSEARSERLDSGEHVGVRLVLVRGVAGIVAEPRRTAKPPAANDARAAYVRALVERELPTRVAQRPPATFPNEGVVKVRLDVAKSGAVSDASIEEPCSPEAACRALLEAVRATLLPPLPDGVAEPLRLVVPVDVGTR